MIQDGVATIPDDGSIELVEMAGKTASADLYERLVMYCRSEVSIALTGTNQTVEANSNKASASAGLEVADDLRDGDAAIVAAAINQLIRWVVEINWGGAAAPVFELWDQEARDQLQATRDKSLKDAGANLSPAYFIRAYKLEEGDVTAPPVPVMAAPAAVDAEKQGKTAEAEPEEKPEFAEPAVKQSLTVDPLAADAARLAQSAQPAVDSLLATVSGYVDAAEDLQGLQDVLLNAYGDLDTTELTRLMAAAFALAKLKGIAAVRGEATGRPVAFAEAPAQPQEPQQIHIHLSEGMVKVDNVVQVPAQAVPEVTVHNTVQVPEQPTPNVTINAEVTPPAVNVAVTNDVQPAAVQVSLPARKTETTVARDNQGNITRATQIETDLP